MNKKMYLTGASGYIGSRLWSKLFDQEHDIETCDFKIGRDVLTYEPEPMDVIYHLSAQAGAMPSWKDPIYDARQNILGTIKACQLANKHNARLVFTTSGAGLNPESPYGLSKKTAEDYVKMLCNDYVILRLSSVYGEKDKGVVDNFIDYDKCFIFGDGSAIRDFVHINDIVEGLIKAKDWKCGEYTMGSGKGTSIIELAQATGKPIEYRDARKGEKQEVVLENTTPNWSPQIDVIDYIKKCI